MTPTTGEATRGEARSAIDQLMDLPMALCLHLFALFWEEYARRLGLALMGASSLVRDGEGEGGLGRARRFSVVVIRGVTCSRHQDTAAGIVCARDYHCWSWSSRSAGLQVSVGRWRGGLLDGSARPLRTRLSGSTGTTVRRKEG
jgi:hypothetical protein